MKPINHIKILLTGVAVMTMLAACSTTKGKNTPSTDYTPQPNVTVTEPASPSSDDAAAVASFNSLASSYGRWTNVNVPLKVEMSKPAKFSISGRAYMVRGKSILISLKFLGMEVATAYVTNDSVYALEKLHKYYFAESLRELLGSYPLTLTDVQDLLIGRAFVLGSGTVSKSDASKVKLDSSQPGALTITPLKQPSGVAYSFEVSTADNAMKSIKVTAGSRGPVVCEYSSPRATPYGTLSEEASIATSMGSKSLDAMLKWDFGSAKWNEKDLRQWSQPKGYKRLGKGQLLEMLTSLSR